GPARPDGGGRARRGAPALRHRAGRSAGQRRLRRAQLLVRLGVPRAVPRRRAVPLPRQRTVLRRVPPARAGRRADGRDHRLRRARTRHLAPVRPRRVARRAAPRPDLAPRRARAPRRTPAPRARPRTRRVGNCARAPTAVVPRRDRSTPPDRPDLGDAMTLTPHAAPRRLVVVVRADPVICGHSGEARNLAEAALLRGFTEVRIVTWPVERLAAAGLPLKPLDSVLPYSPGIEVERPEPVGD